MLLLGFSAYVKQIEKQTVNVMIRTTLRIFNQASRARPQS
jgi:hypothetical protein